MSAGGRLDILPIVKRLESLEPRRVNRLTNKSLRKGGRVVERALRRNVPRRKLRDRGATDKPMFKSIKNYTPRQKRAGEIGVNIVRVKARHAHLIERGTRKRSARSGGLLVDTDALKAAKSKGANVAGKNQIFGRQVAGVKARRFMDRTYKQTRAAATAVTAGALQVEINRILVGRM